MEHDNLQFGKNTKTANKVKIKSTKGEEFGIYAISTLENGDMEITIEVMK